MKIKIATVLIAILAVGRLSAATYYVSNAGNDANPGTSTTQAWATVNKVNLATLAPGDTVLFERGGIWRDQLRPQSGTSGGSIKYDAYGSGPKPLLLASVSANSAGQWTNLGGNLWSAGGLSVSNSNLIVNPTFATNTANWNFYVNTAGGASASFSRSTSVYDSAPASGAISVTAAGATTGDIQLYAINLGITSGRIYTLTFRARSSVGFAMDAPVLMKQSSPYTTYAPPTSAWSGAISTSWATYTLSFVANVTASDARLNLRLGNIPAGATFTIDDVVLQESSTLFPVEVGTINFNNPSYLTNPSFTENTTGWQVASTGSGSATLSRDTVTYNSAPGAAAVAIASMGADVGDIQLRTQNLSLSHGKIYRLAFRARATAAFTLPSPILCKQSSPYTNYFSAQTAWSGSVGTSWASYSIDFTANVDAYDAQLTFSLGNSLDAGQVIYFDDVTLEELPSNASVDTTLQNAQFGFRKTKLADVLVPGDYYYDGAAHTVTLYATANPASIYPTVECALGQHSLNITSKSYITVANLAFHNSGFDGVHIDNAHHLVVENCDIRFVGGGYTTPTSAVRFGNGFQLWGNVHDVNVIGNYVLNVYDSGVANQGTATNQQYNLYFNNNVLLACGMASYELWDRPATSSMSQIYFENNICRDVGVRSWSYNQRSDIVAAHIKLWSSTAAASGIYIRYNTFDTSSNWMVWRDATPFTNLANVTIDQNAYRQTQSPSIFALWNTTTYVSSSGDFSNYRAASGKDANSVLTTFANDEPPTVPRNVAALDGNGQATLSWTAQTWATSYNVKRATTSGGPYTTVASGVTGTSYIDTGLTNLTTYYYRVSALNGFGESPDSLPARVVPSVHFIVDNADAGVTTIGSWTASSAFADRYGPNYLHDGITGGIGGKSVKFTPTLPYTASYLVYMRWPVAATFASNVPVDINHSGGTTTVTVNQRAGGGWVYLGTFMFPAGTTGNIKIRNDGGNGFVIADAVKFVYGPQAPEITSTTHASGQYSVPFSYTITATDSPVSFSATGLPSGLAIDANTGVISGSPLATGLYAVMLGATNAVGTDTQTLLLEIAQAPVGFTLPGGGSFSAPIVASYDGGPLPVEITTSPAGIPVTITYNGSTTPPVLPGTYDVVVTSADPNHVGNAEGTLVINVTALVRHAPTINGDLDGSLQLLSGEGFSVNSSGAVYGDLLVPGTPSLQLNGTPSFGGVVDAAGALTPANYSLTLNGNALVRYVMRRVDPIAMPVVTAPTTPAGTRDVTLNNANQSAGDFATIRNLTLNGKAGTVTVPAGIYGSLTANGNTNLVLGVAGASEPAVYELQALTLNGNASVQVVGPVTLKLAQGTSLNGTMGSAEHPEWLEMLLHNGDLTLNGNAKLHGIVTAPSGSVTINGELHGRVSADRLTLNGNGVLAGADL